MGTEEEIFDSANAPDEEEAVTTAEPSPPPAEQAAGTPPKGTEPPAAPAAAQAVEPPPQQHLVPLKELLDTRERAQAAERERDDIRRRLEHFERQQQAPKPAAPQPPPDMFADPEGYTNWLQKQQQDVVSTVRAEIRNEAIEASCDEAAERHGKLFDEAFQALLRTNDPMLRDRLTARPYRAGEAIVSWYKQQQVLNEVGTDPAAYRQKLADDLLNDEAFLAKAIEKVRAGANGSQPPNGSRPQNVTRLPSLARMTSAAPTHVAGDDDGSEEAIWEAARDEKGRFAAR